MSKNSDIEKGRCISCRHWQGDKDGMRKDIDVSGPIVMDMENGCPKSGGCAIGYKWLWMIISGNATSYFNVQANFGCVLYEEDGD